jgi:hypothetical protein
MTLRFTKATTILSSWSLNSPQTLFNCTYGASRIASTSTGQKHTLCSWPTSESNRPTRSFKTIVAILTQSPSSPSSSYLVCHSMRSLSSTCSLPSCVTKSLPSCTRSRSSSNCVSKSNYSFLSRSCCRTLTIVHHSQSITQKRQSKECVTALITANSRYLSFRTKLLPILN